MTPDVSILAPHISAARRNVGARRTDPADIARILRDHGAYSSAASNAVEAAIREALPAPENQAHLAQVAAAAWDAYDRMRDLLGFDMTRRYDNPAIQSLGNMHNDAYAAQDALNVYGDMIRTVTADWWHEYAIEIDRMCYAEARRLLESREVAA